MNDGLQDHQLWPGETHPFDQALGVESDGLGDFANGDQHIVGDGVGHVLPEIVSIHRFDSNPAQSMITFSLDSKQFYRDGNIFNSK
jgi:hypothetical protein